LSFGVVTDAREGIIVEQNTCMFVAYTYILNVGGQVSRNSIGVAPVDQCACGSEGLHSASAHPEFGNARGLSRGDRILAKGVLAPAGGDSTCRECTHLGLAASDLSNAGFELWGNTILTLKVAPKTFVLAVEEQNADDVVSDCNRLHIGEIT